MKNENGLVRTQGLVHVIGAGLIGSSIGLALREKGVEVSLSDASPAVQALAVDFGAGRNPEPTDSPSLIVVCVPPDVAAAVIANALKQHPDSIVTDVASVKESILKRLSEEGIELANYVGSHPMAGRERGGALSGRADLFIGRPWVVAPHEKSASGAIARVESLALDLGASPITLDPAVHDSAVAIVSHVPQLISSLMAARLQGASPDELALAGQGLRDVTRIAASDPKLWLQILSSNAKPIAKVLEALQQDLGKLLDAVEALATDEQRANGSLASIGRLLEAGNAGVSRIPGKHGDKAKEYAQVTVMIEDKPGELARLLTEVGEFGINLEDLKLEHAPGAQVGLPELSVLPEVAERLVQLLEARGWRVVG